MAPEGAGVNLCVWEKELVALPNYLIHGAEVRNTPGVECLHRNVEAGFKEVLFVLVEEVVGQLVKLFLGVAGVANAPCEIAVGLLILSSYSVNLCGQDSAGVHLTPHLAEGVLVQIAVHVNLINCVKLLPGNVYLSAGFKFLLCHILTVLKGFSLFVVANIQTIFVFTKYFAKIFQFSLHLLYLCAHDIKHRNAPTPSG